MTSLLRCRIVRVTIHRTRSGSDCTQVTRRS